MGTFFRAKTILTFLTIASGCGQALPDQTVCTEIESKSIAAGGKVALTFRIARRANSMSMNFVPYSSIPVTVTEIGGQARDVNYDLRVCVPDCASAPDSAFTQTATTMTSESGILIYTVLSGPKSTGTVLVDLGSVSCLQPVAPASAAMSAAVL